MKLFIWEKLELNSLQKDNFGPIQWGKMRNDRLTPLETQMTGSFSGEECEIGFTHVSPNEGNQLLLV